MADQDAPRIYSNVVQVTRTLWDVTFLFLQARVPRNAKAGDTINLIENAELVGSVTVPLAVAKKMIEILGTVTSDDAIKVIEGGAHAGS